MANGVFTYAKGRFVRYCELPASGDAVLVLLLKSSGLDSDSTLQDYATLGTLLANNNEADFTNYERKELTTGISITVDTTGNKATVDMADFVWLAAGGAVNNTIGKLITAYRPSASATDSDCIPMTYHDCTFTTTGSDLTVVLSSSGLASAA